MTNLSDHCSLSMHNKLHMQQSPADPLFEKHSISMSEEINIPHQGKRLISMQEMNPKAVKMQKQLQKALFRNTMQIRPDITQNIKDFAMIMYEDKNQMNCVCPVVYSSSGSFDEIIIWNWSANNTTIDLEIFALPLSPNSCNILEYGGLSRILFDNGLLQAGAEIPWKISEIPWRKKRVKKQCHHCGAVNSKEVQLRVCGGCKNVRYCTRRCQKQSWNSKHRISCKSKQ